MYPYIGGIELPKLEKNVPEMFRLDESGVTHVLVAIVKTWSL